MQRATNLLAASGRWEYGFVSLMKRRIRSIVLLLAVSLGSVQLILGQLAANFRDERILVGSSHDVFVAKVLKEEGPSGLKQNPLPHTRFRVLVILNIKGHIEGEAFIDQAGGYRNGRFVVVNSDVAHPGKKEEGGMLVPGETYLMVTRSPAVNPENIHWLFPSPYGKTLISQDGELAVAELRKLAMKHEKVRALQEAYQNEIITKRFEKDARNQFRPELGTLPNDL